MVWSPLVLGTILPTCMMKRGPLCRLLDRFFHGKFKGSSVLHHGHIHLFNMNSGMAILYVQCHTTFKLNGCKLLHNLLQPPFKRCNWGHGPGGNMTLRSIIALVMPVLIWISLVFLSTSSLRWRTRKSATCQHAWLIFRLNYFQRTFPDSLAIWQENASHMQKHAVDLLPWMPIMHDFLHVYPSLPNAILFHTWKETITWMSFLAAYISSSSAHSILSKDGCLSISLAFMLSRISVDLGDEE